MQLSFFSQSYFAISQTHKPFLSTSLPHISFTLSLPPPFSRSVTPKSYTTYNRIQNDMTAFLPGLADNYNQHIVLLMQYAFLFVFPQIRSQLHKSIIIYSIRLVLHCSCHIWAIMNIDGHICIMFRLFFYFPILSNKYHICRKRAFDVSYTMLIN